MQAALLSVFHASGSGNLIKIKTLTKQLERGFLDEMLLLQPCGCTGAPPAPVGSAWQGWEAAGVTLVWEQSSVWVSAPVLVSTAWLSQCWDQQAEDPGSVPQPQSVAFCSFHAAAVQLGRMETSCAEGRSLWDEALSAGAIGITGLQEGLR